MKASLYISVLLVAFAHQINGQCFDVSRSSWNARPPTGSSNIGSRVRTFIHHSAGTHCYTQAACAQQVRNIQSSHMDGNGWADIGYNFLVGEDGRVYEGRGWNNLGAHAGGCNTGSVGICVIGTFSNANPNAAALSRVQSFIQCAVNNGLLPSSYRLHGHRNHSATECPGNSFYNLIQGWSNFNSATTC